jgi:hypothetical protein
MTVPRLERPRVLALAVFVSARGSRRGTIAFALRGVGDTAHGRVLLRGPAPPAGCTDPVSKATEPQVVGEIALALARVNVGGRSVGGWLRPFRRASAWHLVGGAAEVAVSLQLGVGVPASPTGSASPESLA